MIDTVKLLLSYDRFKIIRPEKFVPNADQLLLNPYAVQNRAGRVEAYQNSSKEDKEKGIYRPRLTLMKRTRDIYLKIEFSCPKLLFGNNFDEVDDADFDELINKLWESLKSMGVLVAREALREVEVSHVDFSKNIVFTDYTISAGVITLLNQAKMPNTYELTERRFNNGGSAFHLFNGSNELIVYDKVAELKAPHNRANEKDDSEFNPQMTIFEAIRERGPPFEVMRIERRFKSKRVIKHHFKKYGIPQDIRFKTIFSKGLSKHIIQIEWNSLYQGLKHVLLEEMGMCQTIEWIHGQTRWTGQKLLGYSALHYALKEKGDRKLSRNLKFIGHPRTYQRMMEVLSDLDLPKDMSKAKPLFTIDHQINTYNSIKLKQYAKLDFGPKHYEHNS